MKYLLVLVSLGFLITLGGCVTAQPIEFEEEISAPVQTVELEEPTLQSEIPTTTDEEIITQPDNSF